MTMHTTETLTSAFAHTARLFPSRVAVRSLDDQATYAELADWSARISRALVSRLGRQSEPVAILVDPGIAYVAAVLGVLEAGKIFSPIDPLDPAARVRQVVTDLGARLVIVDAGHRAEAERGCADLAEVASLDDLADAGQCQGPADGLPEGGPAPDDPAWVIYTSGSTGRPKGVTQNHRNAVAMTREYARLASITPTDELTLLHPALTWDIFGALLTGAGLHPYDLGRRFAVGIPHWLEAHGVTVLRAFPTTFRRIAAALGPRRLPAVRLVHVSGETFTAGDVGLFRAHFPPPCELLTLFGSSEAGIVTAWIIGRDDEVGNPVPVGRLLEGVGMRLYDESGAEVPPGDVGEIGVASRQVFVGYWRAPDQTARGFHPSDDIDGQPVFMTGDLGAIRPDQLLVHLGRKDFQVKVRGYRIELGEVENALRSHPGVREVAVAPFLDRRGEPQLAAYYTSSNPQPAEEDLRRHVTERLPAYMRPSCYVRLPALPLTANGKTDRRALPAPDAT